MMRTASPLLVLLTVALAGCGDNLPGKPGPTTRPIPADKEKNFAILYRDNCTACHGKDGKRGPAPPLNDPLFLAIVSEKEIKDTLIHGRHGTPMTSFAGNPDRVPAIASTPTALTAEQIDILARKIKEWPAQKETKGLPPYSAKGRKGSIARGKDAYKRACACCHGPDGKEKALAINDPDFLALISEQALRRIIITGRPDLKRPDRMPSYRGERMAGEKFEPLTDEEIDGLQALMVSWKQGSTEGK